jgi:protoheme IX farnesyltransferase
MTPEFEASTIDLSRARRRVADFVALGKPRVVFMVLVTTLVGFHLGSHAGQNYVLLLPTLIGTALAAAGTLALNQYFERDIDALMARTRSRPLPGRRLQPVEALAAGTVAAALGIAYLAVAVNTLSAVVTATITLIYLFAYTPLKRVTPLCSIVGAVPGALPPVTGWVAVRGSLDIEAWILFSILFLWQLPHSLAIARLYRDDYAGAGIRLLPVVEPDSRSTARQVVSNCMALLAVGLLPTMVGMAGALYFAVALVIGITFLGYGIAFARSRTVPAARQLLMASLLYLPTLLIVMALDKVPHWVITR